MVDICHIWYQMRCLDTKTLIFDQIWYVWTFLAKISKIWKILIFAIFSKFFKNGQKMPFLAIFIKIFNRSIWSIYVMYGIKTCLWDPKSQFLGSFDTYHYLVKICVSMKNCHFWAIFFDFVCFKQFVCFPQKFLTSKLFSKCPEDVWGHSVLSLDQFGPVEVILEPKR